MFPLALLAVCHQATTAPTAPVAPQTPSPFTVAPVVAETVRLAITPKLDGKLDEEEWDAFSSGSCDSFLQWEPGKVHVAAKLPVGTDMVASLDLSGNGWLQGNDNVEIRVHMGASGPEVTARRLDATRPEGPTWTEAANVVGAAKAAAGVEGDKWSCEVTLADPGTQMLPKRSQATIGARVDAVAPADALAEAFIPRVVSLVTLAMDRGSNLPAGFTWEPEFKGRSVVPGESFRIRLTFKGTDDLAFKRIDMRTEGLAKNDTASMGLPFPIFDRKNRAFVDYNTDMPANSGTGWRVLRGVITDAAGKSTLMQTSYEVGAVVQFEFEMPKKLSSSAEAQKIRLATFIRSNTKRRVNGVFRIAESPTFTVENGNDKPFIIYNARGSKRQVFEINLPAGFKGALPLKLVAEVGTQVYEQTIWLNVP